jgi:hypothetical protein
VKLTVTFSFSARAVTLVSLSLILSLTLYEFIDYRRVHMVSFGRLVDEEDAVILGVPAGERASSLFGFSSGQEPSIVVDKSRGEKLVVNLDIDFPRVPCYCEVPLNVRFSGATLTALSVCSTQRRHYGHLRRAPERYAVELRWQQRGRHADAHVVLGRHPPRHDQNTACKGRHDN